MIGPSSSLRTDYSLFFLSLLTIVLFGIFGFNPLLSSTFAVYADLQNGQSYQTALAQKIEALAEAKKNFDAIANKLSGIDKAVPTGASQPELIQEISLDAGRSGITIEAIFFRDRSQVGKVGYEIFDLAANGQEANLTRFLKELEKDRVILFDAIRTVVKREGGEESLGITIRGRSIFVP